MRIVGGKHKRRALKAPSDRTIRPTSDRAREAIFNLLAHAPSIVETGFGLDGAAVLDAFCGTGALGLEALSRGAAAVAFLDISAGALDLARANAEAIGEAGRTLYVAADATNPPEAPGAHDLVLLDPPYGKDLAAPALTALANRGWIAPGAVVVLERAANGAFQCPTDFNPLEDRAYGKTLVTLLCYPQLD